MLELAGPRWPLAASERVTAEGAVKFCQLLVATAALEVRLCLEGPLRPADAADGLPVCLELLETAMAVMAEDEGEEAWAGLEPEVLLFMRTQLEEAADGGEARAARLVAGPGG